MPEPASQDDEQQDDPSVTGMLQWMAEVGIPINRQSYLESIYGGGNAPRTEDWTAEHESQLPKALQDWSLFDKNFHYIGPPIGDSSEAEAREGISS